MKTRWLALFMTLGGAFAAQALPRRPGSGVEPNRVPDTATAHRAAPVSNVPHGVADPTDPRLSRPVISSKPGYNLIMNKPQSDYLFSEDVFMNLPRQWKGAWRQCFDTANKPYEIVNLIGAYYGLPRSAEN